MAAGTVAVKAAKTAHGMSRAAPVAKLGLKGLLAKGGAGLSALAMNPATLPILMAAGIAGQFIPSKAERQYRKALRKERKALDAKAKRGEGGLTRGQRNRLYAESEGRVQAQEEQMKAEIARIQDPVARQQALQGMQERGMQVRAQERSGVRDVDMKAYQDRVAAVMGQQYQQAKLGAQSKVSRGQVQAQTAGYMAKIAEEKAQRDREKQAKGLSDEFSLGLGE